MFKYKPRHGGRGNKEEDRGTNGRCANLNRGGCNLQFDELRGDSVNEFTRTPHDKWKCRWPQTGSSLTCNGETRQCRVIDTNRILTTK